MAGRREGWVLRGERAGAEGCEGIPGGRSRVLNEPENASRFQATRPLHAVLPLGTTRALAGNPWNPSACEPLPPEVASRRVVSSPLAGWVQQLPGGLTRRLSRMDTSSARVPGGRHGLREAARPQTSAPPTPAPPSAAALRASGPADGAAGPHPEAAGGWRWRRGSAATAGWPAHRGVCS